MERFDVAVVGMGALGSAAAYHLGLAGASTVAFEQHELGHARGASHDTSRIVRTSYGDADYVRFAQAAYREWADLEARTGERLLTITGGVVLAPHGSPHSIDDFAASLDATGVPYERLAPAEVRSRWPRLTIDDDVDAVFTADTGIAHAGRTVAVLQLHARALGVDVRDRTPVTRLEPVDDGVLVHAASGVVHARSVIVAADAWTNALLEPLGERIPLDVMQEQVTYFAPPHPERLDADGLPVWVWLDDHCFYGFPTYGEPTIKAARDVSDHRMTPDERTFQHSRPLLDELTAFVGGLIAGAGEPERTVTCQYALTPDRRFVVDRLPSHPAIVVGLGAGHAFKFTPAFGRALAELAQGVPTTDDLGAFTIAGLRAATEEVTA